MDVFENKFKNHISEYGLHLKCRDCGKEFEFKPMYICDECFGALDVVYDLERIELNKDER